jgi:hypothetical protein
MKPMKTIYAMTFAAGLALGEQQVVISDNVPGQIAAGRRTMSFIRGAGEAAVKGAPYSADSVTEHVQTLPDGNRISQTNKSSFSRDSEGRTRRENTIQGLGRVGQTEAPIVSVFIEDPVAKVQYTLDSERKIAIKHKSEGGPTPIHFEASTLATTVHRDDVVMERKIMTTAVPAHSIGIAMRTRLDGNNGKQEDLGIRNIEGVSAKGTRMVMTIPAGEVGNERPMEVVTETWYSDEIKAVVLTKHSDPRSGEMTTKLTNVHLGEPSKSLFEPPTDYKVEEASNMRMAMPTKVFRVKEDR